MIFFFFYSISFCLTEERAFFWFQRTFALPHTRRRWAFCAWAFGGGLAAVLCSRMPFFYFFYFCSRKNSFFYDV
jgi:hypothetical protein